MAENNTYAAYFRRHKAYFGRFLAAKNDFHYCSVGVWFMSVRVCSLLCNMGLTNKYTIDRF
jgi:hypothetical protein